MAKKRVFVSFDYDHDDFLKTAIVGQSKLVDSPFELADWSIKEHLTGDWKAKARTRIKSVDIVVIMCGEHTHTAAGVNAEMEIAKDEGVTYFLLKGYANKTCTKPTSATGSDKMYDWTWPNLKLLIGGNR